MKRSEGLEETSASMTPLDDQRTQDSNFKVGIPYLEGKNRKIYHLGVVTSKGHEKKTEKL